MSRSEAQGILDQIRAEAADCPEMTIEEINEEIRAVRKKRHKKQNTDNVT